MMEDCNDTTIIIPSLQFASRYLSPADADGFNAAFPKDKVAEIHVTFKALMKTPEDSPPEESEISKAWRDIDMNIARLCDDEHFFHLSESKADRDDNGKNKIDASFLPNNLMKWYEKDTANFAIQAMSIKFKRGGTKNDPFDDRREYDNESLALSRKMVRGQLMAYSARLFHKQHRKWHFQLLVNGREFRFLRWDHSGVIVTEAEDYVTTLEDTEHLLKMLYGFSRLNRSGKGYDDTVEELSDTSVGWTRMGQLTNPHPDDITPDTREASAEYHIAAEFHPDIAEERVVQWLKDKAFYADPRRDDNRQTPPDTHMRDLRYLPTFDYIRAKFKSSIAPGNRRYIVKIDGGIFLVGSPVFVAFGAVGRGTRGFIALEWATQRFVFIKDTWRPFYAGLPSEGDVLKTLNEGSVRNVRTLVCYEDVPGHETETSHYSPVTGNNRRTIDLSMRRPVPDEAQAASTHKCGTASPATRPLPSTPRRRHAEAGTKRTRDERHAQEESAYTEEHPKKAKAKKPKFIQGTRLRHMLHHRIVVKEVCKDSIAFTSGRQWARMILQTLYAHHDAVEKCYIVHRDVSTGNILMYPVITWGADKKALGVTQTGLLADWELAKDKRIEYARQIARTGTWQFIPVRCLLDPRSAIRIADELESFFHVFLYNSVRLVPSNLLDVQHFVRSYFDARHPHPTKIGEISVSKDKHDAIVNGKITTTSALVELAFASPRRNAPHPFNALIAELLKHFKSRYAVGRWTEWEALNAARKTTDEEPSKAAKTPTLPPVREETTPPAEDSDEESDQDWDLKPVARKSKTGNSIRPKALLKPDPEAPPRPDDHDFARSAALDTHDAIIGIFERFVVQDKAKKEDRVKWPKKDLMEKDALAQYVPPPRRRAPKRVRTDLLPPVAAWTMSTEEDGMDDSPTTRRRTRAPQTITLG
ncbi:uncharacterized protein BXZ73DRAFT_50266 [Epithele typhae]|uniref:uncharacterized protein n=1 Tax=Epithele typhae TaxID=378194 RepID=UPI002007B5BC|nr:uncharacterized protein BXZ73DRAFT_50266 [Epithele typhae]KAH9924997.1 hypothetical protein BXZ73DRAFT_50266 [Epithele typhae]